MELFAELLPLDFGLPLTYFRQAVTERLVNICRVGQHGLHCHAVQMLRLLRTRHLVHDARKHAQLTLGCEAYQSGIDGPQVSGVKVLRGNLALHFVQETQIMAEHLQQHVFGRDGCWARWTSGTHWRLL